jgi:hypothetical protein
MDTTRFRTSPLVRASISADGLVLLDVGGGVVLASNAIGARIWQLIEERCTSGDIARRLAADYGIPLERAHGDVGGFIASLTTRGLVTEEPTC